MKNPLEILFAGDDFYSGVLGVPYSPEWAASKSAINKSLKQACCESSNSSIIFFASKSDAEEFSKKCIEPVYFAETEVTRSVIDVSCDYINRRNEMIDHHLEIALKNYLKVDDVLFCEDLKKRCAHYDQPSNGKEWWTIDGITIMESNKGDLLQESFIVYNRV